MATRRARPDPDHREDPTVTDTVYTLPDLPYDYAALEPHYSAEVVELHHDKHHA
ncbi:MAG: hypothetical protein KDB35_03245, partial [Acidimicrobiales bacterium]|nr:hypothetical protein [Acidimicrobiales bacterium]